MAEKLTPQQETAVHDRGGRLLVSAAAGSGKTKVLVDRLLDYLTDPVEPGEMDDFLIITYTKAAASELRSKIAGKLNQRIAQEPENRHLQQQLQKLYLAQISTVHGFCTQVLREYAYQLDIAPDFRVADETETQELRQTVVTDLVGRAYEEQGDDEYFRAFVDTQGLGRNDSALPELILQVYDSARCHLDPQAWLDQCRKAFRPSEGIDAGQTPWGAFLLQNLKETTDGHIAALTSCRERAGRTPRYEKITQILTEIICQLSALRDSETWDSAVENREIAYPRLSFPKKDADPELNEYVRAAVQGCKDAMKKLLKPFSGSSESRLRGMAQSADAMEGLCSLVSRFDKAYAKAKRSRRVLDFGDLEHRTLDLFLGKNRQTPTAAAREIARRYREVMVDEYQDSNAVQDAIFSVLTRERNNCFLVGDVKQSIYRFRLADPTIFLEKYNDFVPAETARAGQSRKVLLSHNFRSGGEVIDAVNHVFRICMSPQVGGVAYGDGESLREGVPHIPLPDPATELYVLETTGDKDSQEAALAARRMKEMLDSGTLVRDGDGLRPMTPGDVAVLLLTPSSQGEDYRAALEAAGISCHMGGGVDLLKTREVQDLWALLSTVSNPRQDIPLITAMTSPLFGFTAEDLARIRAADRGSTVFDALRQQTGEKETAFLNVLSRLRKKVREGTLTELMVECFLTTRADSVYGALPGGEARRENLRTFFQMAVEFDGPPGRSLNRFLENLENLQSSGKRSADTGGGESVTIMSIHRSKGLEYPVVFLCGLTKQFNMEDSKRQILCDGALGLGPYAADTEKRVRYPTLPRQAIAASMARESVSEQMRILYVAMTRARDRLVMTCAGKYIVSKLKEIAHRMPLDGGKLLCREANCHADWVLMAAMKRTEAWDLRRLGESSWEGAVGEYPWKIRVVEPETEELHGTERREAPQAPPPEAEEILRRALAWGYDHTPATMAPSKQTATGRKGREKDEEAAENTRRTSEKRVFRRPSFREEAPDGRARGTAVHAAMQYISFPACTGVDGTAAELDRLTETGRLTKEQRELIDPAQIAPFFDTPVGARLRRGGECIREFKFSILEDGSEFGDGLAGEQVLMQGVVDCALMEEDGITVLDFKTDFVSDQTLPELIRRYRPQVETYAAALSRIFEKPVKEAYLYFFRGSRLVKL